MVVATLATLAAIYTLRFCRGLTLGVTMRILGLLLAGVCLSGCATITRGTTQDFTVTSSPSGASVKTTTGFECAATPCTFKMPRKTGFSVEKKLNGYQTENVLVESKVAGSGAAGMAGNILVGA